MAHAHRYPYNSLKEHLFSEVHRYSFFQAVELMHTLYPESQPLGEVSSAQFEPVRFSPVVSFGFSPSELHRLSLSSDEEEQVPQIKLETAFFSLFGRHGVLPWHYTSQMRDEKKNLHKEALVSFINIFNHRYLSHFYRAGMKYRLPHHHRHEQKNHYTQLWQSFMGMGTRGLSLTHSSTQFKLSAYSSLFQQPRSAHGLAILLEDYFQVKVAIEEFVGEWVAIEERSRTTIGSRGKNRQLGHSFCMGKRSWSRQHKFCVALGPLSYLTYQELGPGGSKHEELYEVIRLFVGITFTFSLSFIVEGEKYAGFALGDRGVSLGTSLWLKKKDSVQHLHTHFEPINQSNRPHLQIRGQYGSHSV